MKSYRWFSKNCIRTGKSLLKRDGAKEKWLKAPKTYGTCYPKSNKDDYRSGEFTNVRAPLDEEHVHNREFVQDIVKREWCHCNATYACSNLCSTKQGFIPYSKGKKILFCTGYDTVQHRIIDDFISHVVDSDITAIVLADGYKASCEIRRIIQCR